MHTALLTLVTMLHITPWLTYFITGSLYLLIPFTYVVQTPPWPLATTNVFCVSYSSVWFLLFLDSTYKWDYMVFVFLCLTYFTIMPSRSIHVVAKMARFPYFLWLNNIPVYVCVYLTFSLSIHLSIDTLFPCLGYCK